MAVNILLIALGFALLVKGADFLVDGASGVAKRFHIPEIIIGLTIVSIGTSMPELFVSITSAIDGYSDMAIGNVIGYQQQLIQSYLKKKQNLLKFQYA